MTGLQHCLELLRWKTRAGVTAVLVWRCTYLHTYVQAGGRGWNGMQCKIQVPRSLTCVRHDYGEDSARCLWENEYGRESNVYLSVQYRLTKRSSCRDHSPKACRNGFILLQYYLVHVNRLASYVVTKPTFCNCFYVVPLTSGTVSKVASHSYPDDGAYDLSFSWLTIP